MNDKTKIFSIALNVIIVILIILYFWQCNPKQQVNNNSKPQIILHDKLDTVIHEPIILGDSTKNNDTSKKELIKFKKITIIKYEKDTAIIYNLTRIADSLNFEIYKRDASELLKLDTITPKGDTINLEINKTINTLNYLIVKPKPTYKFIQGETIFIPPPEKTIWENPFINIIGGGIIGSILTIILIK